MEPDASRHELLPISNFDAATSQAPRLGREITIAALSFEGLSGEGDSHALRMLLEEADRNTIRFSYRNLHDTIGFGGWVGN